MSGGVWGGVWGVSARCQGRLVVSGGVRRCFGGALDTFSDLGTLGPPPQDIQESWTPGLIGLNLKG